MPISVPTKVFATLAVTLTILVFSGSKTYAQQFPSLGGVAVNVEIADSEATVGDILTISKEGLKRSTLEYDIGMYGVVALNPVLSVEPKTDKTKSVLSSGTAEVRVSTANGTIEVGDYITSSTAAGVGVKVTASGYVLGKALAKYDDSSKVGLIPVAVEISYFGGAGIGGAGVDRLASDIANIIRNPEKFPSLFRYVIAFLIATFTFVGVTFSFIKFVSAGITAMGRNPLAKGTIIAGMVLSGTVVAVLAVAGFGTAAFILGIGKLWFK